MAGEAPVSVRDGIVVISDLGEGPDVIRDFTGSRRPTRPRDPWGALKGMDRVSWVSTGSSDTSSGNDGWAMARMVLRGSHLRLSCAVPAWSLRGPGAVPRSRPAVATRAARTRRKHAGSVSALVFEADLELHPVLDDLAVLDDRTGLHDLYGADVADRL